METCGNCKHWDTIGFGLREDWGSQKATQAGRCQLVARHWYPCSSDKMIALNGIEHIRWPASELIAVVTRREFGCNQFKPEDRNPALCRIFLSGEFESLLPTFNYLPKQSAKDVSFYKISNILEKDTPQSCIEVV